MILVSTMRHKVSRKKMHEESGMTLIEMLLYMGMLSLMLVVITTILTNTLQMKLESKSFYNIENEARFILSKLVYDIRNADSITLPALPGQSGPSLVLTANGIGSTYSLSGDDIVIQNNYGTNSLNSSNNRITSLSFQRIGIPGTREAIKVTMTIESTVKRNVGIDTQSYEVTVNTR